MTKTGANPSQTNGDLLNGRPLTGLKKNLVLKLKPQDMHCFRHAIGWIIVTALFAMAGTAQAQCPNASLTVSQQDGCVPAPFTFSINNPPANAAEVTYDVGVQASTVDISQDFSITYGSSQTGTYSPSAVLLDANGDTICRKDLDIGEIQAFENPTADFSVGSSSPCFSENEYQFTDETILGDAPISNWQWTFGDGNSSNQQNPLYSYQQSIDQPNIVLSVTDTNGCTNTTQARASSVTVLEPLNPEFTVTGKNPDCPETEVTLNNKTANDTSRIRSISFDFDDPDNTTRTFNKGSDGWGNEYDTTSFTYTEEGTYEPSLTITDNNGCDSTFTFSAGVTNVVFNFDSSIVTKSPICGPSTTAVPFSHTPDPNSNQAFIFGTLDGQFAPHMPPPNPVERGIWSGSHEYPSSGVKSIQLNVANVCGQLDTLYRRQAVIEGPTAQINLPEMQLPLDNRLSALDRPISGAEFQRADRRGCLQVDQIEYVRRNTNGGVTNQTFTWTPGDNPVTSPDFPFQMVFFQKQSRLFSDIPEGPFTLDPLTTADTVVTSSISVDFTSGPTYTPGNGITVNRNESGVVLDFTQEPNAPPFTFRVNYRAGDSTVYRPASGTLRFQNMHDTDVYKPNCQAPNLVRFANNSIKRRAFRGPNGNVKKRKFFYIDREKSDSIYRTLTINGNQDTLYYHSYLGYDIAPVLDNQPFFQVNDSTRQQFRSRTIPFDNDLPYAEVFDDNQGAHGLPLDIYLDRLLAEGYLPGGTEPNGREFGEVGAAPGEGYPRNFDLATSFQSAQALAFYQQDFKDTFLTDRNDDLSPWGSDSLDYVWNFADPNGERCTTRTAWASKQKDFLYREFVDTAQVSSINSNGVALIPLNLPNEFNDTIANNRTRVNVFTNGNIGLGDLNTYGEFHDVEYISGTPTLRIWDSDITANDEVAIRYSAGSNAFSGRRCNFSTAAAPYHYYDSSGCWSAQLQAVDSVTGCPPSVDVQRIYMGPPRADWSQEAYRQERTAVLTQGYTPGTRELFLDSLKIAQDKRDKAAEVLTDQPITVQVANSFTLDPSEYRIEQDSVARLILTNPSRIRIGSKIEASYVVRKYDLIDLAGDGVRDTVNVTNMRYDIQQKLPEWNNGDADTVVRRGLQLLGPKCQGRAQEIDVSETLPQGQCGGTEDWALIIDTASTISRKPGFQGGPFEWDTATLKCSDTLLKDNGTIDTIVNRFRSKFNWLTNGQVWSRLQPPQEFSYDTSGCVDVGFWVQSGNCVDTHFYRNYKYIADLENDFSFLNPDTLSPSPDNQYGPLASGGLPEVAFNSSYSMRNVGDTTRILVSPVREQERIEEYEISNIGLFRTLKRPANPYRPLDTQRTNVYNNFQKDTAYVLCDSLIINTIQVPGGNNRQDTTCVDRTIYPERVCGNSIINDIPIDDLRKEKVVLDSFPLLEMGGTVTVDSINHSDIGTAVNPTILDTLPNRSKLYQYDISVTEFFGNNDSVYLVSIDQNSIRDTILKFPNNDVPLRFNNTSFGNPMNYLGIIEDSSNLRRSLQDSTTLALIKNRQFTQGAIKLKLRYKPVITENKVDKPGIYRLTSDITNAQGCGGNPISKVIEVGHYGRFDPEVPDRSNNNVICSNSDNDTVYFNNKVKANATEPYEDMGNFPRYYDYRVTQTPAGPEIEYLADDNYWKDPKGVRDNPITDDHQYERLFWDLDGDGYYETEYDINSLRYIQDRDGDGTFEQTLDSVDADNDGLKEVVPYYVYDSSGIYDVSMKSIDSTGKVQVMTREDLITVTGLQVFSDTLTNGVACAPVTIDFYDDSEITFQYNYETNNSGQRIDSTKVDSATSWSWEFNDGKDSITNFRGDTVTKTFTRNDTFDVQLKVETAAGCVDSSFLTASGGDSTVVKDGDTLTRNANNMAVEIIGPNPEVTLQSRVKCQPATFVFADSSEAVTEWQFDKDNGSTVTYTEQDLAEKDGVFEVNYQAADTYNMDITGFGQVPNTATADPTDSFRCAAPVRDTTLPDFDSTRFEVTVKETDSVNFAFDNTDLCPEENLGSNPRTNLALSPDVDRDYDSFRWALGQGDTLLRTVHEGIDLSGEDPYQYYDENSYDTFDVALIPIDTDSTLCYDTAVETLRTTAINASLDTTPQPEAVTAPRSKYTYTNESDSGDGYRYKWYFFGAEPTVQESTLESSLGQSGVYYSEIPGDGGVFETDTVADQEVQYYTDRGYYWTALRAINPQGCHLTDTIRIDNVKDTTYERSNVFSPNGDGTNDRFTFRVQGDESFKLTIYNRWGTEVYQTTSGSSNNNCFWTNEVSDFNGDCNESGKDPSNPRGCKYCEFWDGTTQSGADAAAGTYFYKITYNYEETEDGRGGQGDTQTGTVTLLR